jgi:hypothetical protein
LTDLISQAQAYEPDTPWLRANPVMLDNAMAVFSGRKGGKILRRT